MISAFSLKPTPKIIFGPGVFAKLGGEISRFGSRALLVFGHSSFIESVRYAKLCEELQVHGVTNYLCRIETEPSPEVIDTIVETNIGNGIDVVVAIGGGSVLDGGKAIAAMMIEQKEVRSFLEGVGHLQPSGKKLPFIAVPTTAGTGSEATANAVLSLSADNGFKKSLRHENYVPDIALVDPDLTRGCPPEITVACGMDCFTQLVEGYFSTSGSSLTDALALDGIQAIKRSLRVAVLEGDNSAARADMSYAALLSGIVLANAGLGTIHGFASAIGGLFAIPHGVVCGTLMAQANAFTLKRLQEENGPALEKYTRLGEVFSGTQGKSATWYQQFFIDELEGLVEELALPKLGRYGVSSLSLDQIISRTSNKNNPVDLDDQDLKEILLTRLD